MTRTSLLTERSMDANPAPGSKECFKCHANKPLSEFYAHPMMKDGHLKEEGSMSEFKVEAVRIGQIEKHPNADSLSITQVLGGYPCIIKTGDFSEGELAIYVPVDALVPVDRPEFAFLEKESKHGQARIKARRLRGIFSMGLLVKCPRGVKEGADCQKILGIEKYLPPAEREPQEQQQHASKSWPWWKRLAFRFFPSLFRKSKPQIACPVYDIEGYRKHKNLFQPGEEVVITEKIHGANARFVFTKGKFHIGSRTQFGRNDASDWGIVAKRYGLAEKLKRYPDLVLLGEVYGNVQDLKYGLPNSVDLACFDAMDLKTRKFLDYNEFIALCDDLEVATVPVLYRGPWGDELVSLAEGKTTMPNAKHVREGIVIKPAVERIDHHFGRVILKLHGEGYLTRKEAAE